MAPPPSSAKAMAKKATAAMAKAEAEAEAAAEVKAAARAAAKAAASAGRLLPEAGPCLKVQIGGGKKGVLSDGDLLGGIAGMFGPGSAASQGEFAEAVLDRSRMAYLVQAAVGTLELTIVRNGAVVQSTLKTPADLLQVKFAKEDLSLDWSDVLEHWLDEPADASATASTSSSSASVSASKPGPASSSSRRSSSAQPPSRPPPPGAPSGGHWVRVSGPCWRCGAARDEYRKGRRAWGDDGLLLRGPSPSAPKPPPQEVVTDDDDDGVIEFDPRMVTKGTTTRKIQEQWEEEERARQPVSLEQAFLNAGLPKTLMANQSGEDGAS